MSYLINQTATCMPALLGTADCSYADMALFIVLKVVFALAAIIVIMCFAALSVVAERKVCAYIQGRYGPNRTAIPIIAAIPLVGNFLKKNGLMQLVADGLKFLLKEDPLPAHVSKLWYLAAPIMSLSPILICACLIPFGVWWDSGGAAHPLAAANIDVSLLAVLAIGALGVYGAIMAGWSSNSKFPYMGAIRASAQVISYELTMALAAMSVVLYMGSVSDSPLSLFEIASAQEQSWFFMTQPLAALLFIVALFAETNRLPFDMAESETDLVSGFHTEYGSFKFGLFFVGEYGHVALGSALFIILFLGAWNPLPYISYPESWGWISTLLGFITFLVKISAMIFFFIWVRWTLPRFRYDQVMALCWKCLMPLALANLVFYMAIAAI